MSAQGFRSLRIAGWRQFEDIRLEIHPRLTIITGANGAGKSTLLSFFSRHFGYNRNFISLPVSGKLGKFLLGLFSSASSKLNWKQEPNHARKIGEIIYDNGGFTAVRLPDQQGIHFYAQLDNQQEVEGIHIDSHRPPTIYRNVSSIPSSPPNAATVGSTLNAEFINFYANGQSSVGGIYHIKLALIQMSIFGHGNSTMEPIPELIRLFGSFEDILRKILPPSLGFQRLLIRSPEVVLSTRSGDFLIDAASGGIIKLIEIAWQIYFYSIERENFVVTMDEPENHLHPSMQKSFMPNLVSAFPQAQFIVVTHSPFIISSSRESNVYALRYIETISDSIDSEADDSVKGLMGAKVEAIKLDTVNKAGTASEILRDVLGIESTMPDWAESRVSEIVASYRGMHLTEDKADELFSRLSSEGLTSKFPDALHNLTVKP